MKSRSARKPNIFMRKSFILSLAGLCILMAGILGLNILMIRRTERAGAMSEGQMQLTNITAEVEANLFQAESIVESLAGQLELIMSDDIDDTLQLDKFVRENDVYVAEKTQGMGFTVYATYKGKLYIEDFEPDENYDLNEREWNKGARKKQGEIYITSPYIDANTGKMCYSVSKLLSDGDTVIGVDYKMDRIQTFIEEMSAENGGISMIVNDAGTVIGHTDPSGVGQDYTTLPHADIVRKMFSLYGDSFVYESGGERYNIFSDKTSYGWYLIVCVDSLAVAQMMSGEFNWIIAIIALLAVSIIIYYIFTYRARMTSKLRISEREDALEKIRAEWERYSMAVTSRSRLAYRSGAEEDESDSRLLELTERMSSVFDDVMKPQENAPADEETGIHAVEKGHNRNFILIVCILMVTSAATFVINTVTQLSTIDFRMDNEVKDYSYQVKEWAASNKTLVNTLSQVFSAKPELIEDYESCVQYLDEMVGDYEEVSVAYLVNPEWEHPVIMNNGWESDDPDWNVAERQWYKETLASPNENGFNISTPYIDSQFGYYCVTLSQIVYDGEGNRIGILGIDYYMDKLISILGRSYTESGYAFLVDMNYNILNHPNEGYQMTAESSCNAGELCYRSALTSDKSVVIEDYDGKQRLCLIQEDDVSGFSVILVKDWWYMYGSLLISDLAFLMLFGTCMIIVIVIMSRTNRRDERVRRELQLAAEKANAASRAKDDFLANMSHEIRTPMNAVVGMCEMILREDDISDTVRDCCYNIRNSGKSLLSIINDILDFSKIESGKMELIDEVFNIASTLDDVINMAVTRKGDKKLEIIVHTEAGIPSGLIGDELRIRQMIINIVTNAIKYTPSGAVIISVSHRKTGEGISMRVSVKDTGIGISEENLNKIFSSFQQVDTKKNRSVEGTGLGLAITQRLIGQMGGTVNVSSVYGEGSEFVLEIPLKVAEASPFISVKEPAKISAAGYVDIKKFDLPLIGAEYQKLVSELSGDLGVPIRLYDDIAELERAAGENTFSHIFAAKEEYTANKAFFDAQAEKSDIVVICDRNEAAELPQNVRCIFKPFYALSAAAVFNNERVSAGYEERGNSIGFTAPDARVLIVDDNLINLKVASGLMKPYKMQLFTADSADAALKALADKNIDLVFMDHMMPVTDGVEATSMIRSKEDGYYKKLPIIALTANAINGVKELFLQAGMNDFMAKPIEVSALDHILRTWLPAELIRYSDAPVPSAPSVAEAAPESDVLFDPQSGVAAIGGDKEAYLDIVSTFVREGEKQLSLISGLYEKEEWKDYVIQVHGLKSSSLTIGAKPLSSRAKELELAGKEQRFDVIREKNAALLEMYSLVIWEARKFAEENAPAQEEAPAELTEIDFDTFQEYAESIKAACLEYDSDKVTELCGELSSRVCRGKALRELLDGVRAAAADFDCDEAAEKLEEAILYFY